MRVPIVTADPTVGWALEGSELAVSDSTLSEIVLVPKKLAGLTVVTNELAADSDVALEQIGQGLVRDLQRKLDAAYFGSTITKGPSGLGSLASTAVDAGDSWTNLDTFEAAKSAAETINTTLTAFVCAPATALILAQLKEATGSNKQLLSADAPTSRTIAGLPLYVSPAVTGAGVVWGIPKAHSLVVIRNDAPVVTDSSVYFTSDRAAIRATLRLDLGFTYPASVIRIAPTP